MRELEVIERALVAAPSRPLKATLARCVALLPLTAAGAPDYFCFSEAARAKGEIPRLADLPAPWGPLAAPAPVGGGGGGAVKSK